MEKTKNPWKILQADIQYDNPWIQVTEHAVIHPGGRPGIYGTVHYKNQAVGVIPYEKGCIWMVGQYRFPLERFSWEIPEGGSPIGEEPLDTAKRELEEETGLAAGKYEALFEMHLSNSVSDEWGIVYLATDLKEGTAKPEDTEELLVEKWQLEKVFEAVESGQITDSLTIAAIYKLMYLKATGQLPED